MRKVRFFELQRTIHHQRLEECQKWTKSESCCCCSWCSWCCYCRRWCCRRRSQMATVHFRSTCPSVAKLHTPKIMETVESSKIYIAFFLLSLFLHLWKSLSRHLSRVCFSLWQVNIKTVVVGTNDLERLVFNHCHIWLRQTKQNLASYHILHTFLRMIKCSELRFTWVTFFQRV